MTQLSHVGAFVLVATVLAGGLMALNEAILNTEPQPEHQELFEHIEGLLILGADISGLLVILLMAGFVMAVFSGRL